jgi:hypothetical protein
MLGLPHTREELIMSKGTLTYRSMDEVRAAHHGHWFDASTLRFFRSRVSDTIYGGRFFVTSEQDGDHPRRYTIRVAHPEGAIDTVGAFQQYATGSGAHKAAQRLGAEWLSTGVCPCGNH